MSLAKYNTTQIYGKYVSISRIYIVTPDYVKPVDNSKITQHNTTIKMMVNLNRFQKRSLP